MSENKSKKGTPAASDWSDEEKAAMKERAKELKAESLKRSNANDEQAVMDKIDEMPELQRVIALRLHEMIKQEFPDLYPKTWCGKPAYQLGRKTLVFFQSALKFGSRYNTIGFSDTAKLDGGAFWPTSFALVALNSEVEAQIRDLIRKAIS